MPSTQPPGRFDAARADAALTGLDAILTRRCRRLETEPKWQDREHDDDGCRTTAR